MTTVILAEKPSQARAYVAAFQKSQKKSGYYEVSDPVLPNDTLVTHALGHLVELVPPEKYDAKYRNWALANLPIFPTTYQFEVIADKQKQFQVVKTLLNRANTIIVAGDNGREGENIAWSIMKKAQIDVEHKTMQRLWINSLEKEAIITGFRDLKDGWQFYPNYQEAQTRQISDWLVGMNASPLYTLLLRQHGLSGVYAIGRVQTPTLYMVYQRDQLIKNFKPELYLELNAEILANQQKFEAKLDPYQRFKDEKGLTIFMQAKSVQRGPQTALIKDVQNIVKKTPSPRLFSLSSLQSAVNQRFHASASETLAAVQALYEAKWLTYPRTDSEYLTQQEFDYLAANLDQYQELLPEKMALPQTTPQKRYVNDQKVTPRLL
ncbi:DNA topoisomerase III [Lactiplantibacillus plantarum]|nr:DNA topoisomerase III [Lactiplantibacillus plantarum]